VAAGMTTAELFYRSLSKKLPQIAAPLWVVQKVTRADRDGPKN